MAKDKTTKVRILTDTVVDGGMLKADAVVTLDPDDAKALIDQGVADANPDAVAYAESLATAEAAPAA